MSRSESLGVRWLTRRLPNEPPEETGMQKKRRHKKTRRRSNHFLSPQAGVQLGDLKTQLDGTIAVRLKLESRSVTSRPRLRNWSQSNKVFLCFLPLSISTSLWSFLIWLGWPGGGPQETARDRLWRSRSYRYFFVIKQEEKEEKEREGNSKLKVANHLSGQTHYCQNCLGRRTELAFRRREARTCSPMRFRGQIGGWSVCQREEPQDQEVLLLSSLTATSLHLFSFNKV